jgi:NAD(P)-dependent dehydrogenase (short-subunit alcohol dehydrogenase family)
VVVNCNTRAGEAAESAAEIEKINRRALIMRDILVNNAGVFMVRPRLELTEDEWIGTIGVNLKGVFLCSQIIGKAMIERRTGVIINISSVVASASFPNRAAYCAAKAGVVSLTKTLAIEWARYNIRVNCVAPAYVETQRVKDEAKAGTRDISPVVERTPMKGLG